MTKSFTDKDTYDFILDTLKQNGISKEIIDLANRMDINLPRMFYEKILCVTETKELSNNTDVIVKTLLGVYGNYITACYYKSLGYDVKNEYRVYDNGDLITRADVAFNTSDGKLNLIEVKTTPQIIDNIRNYNSNNEDKYNGKYYYDKDNDIIKYKEIGNKLIKQASKLLKTKANVTVVIFDGCFMDDIIRDKILKKGVSIFKLGVNINDLEEQIYDMVYEIIDVLKSKKVSKNVMSDK